LRAVALPVGADWFAVDMQSVREIVPLATITPIPTAPPEVVGLFNVRGQLVPLFDTGRLLGLPPGDVQFATLVEAAPGMGARGLVGLGSTGPAEVVELGSPTGPSDLAASRGTFTVPIELGRPRAVVLLDVAQLFPSW